MEENTVLFIEPLIERVQEYGKSSIELYKLKAVEKSSAITSNYISRGIAFFVLSLFIIMVSIGAAFWLGELLGKTYFGFLCVGAFYGFVGTLLYLVFHDSIKRRINNKLISEILK